MVSNEDAGCIRGQLCMKLAYRIPSEQTPKFSSHNVGRESAGDLSAKLKPPIKHIFHHLCMHRGQVAPDRNHVSDVGSDDHTT